MCMATGRMAVSLNSGQVAAALAVVDGVTASLARGMAAPLPTRAPMSEGAATQPINCQPVRHTSCSASSYAAGQLHVS